MSLTGLPHMRPFPLPSFPAKIWGLTSKAAVGLATVGKGQVDQKILCKDNIVTFTFAQSLSGPSQISESQIFRSPSENY